MVIESDPVAGAVLAGLLAAPAGALLVRRGRWLSGAAVAAVLGLAAILAIGAAHAGLAAVTGAAGALLLPGSLRGWRRGTFEAAFGRAAFSGGRAEAPLPGRPTRHVPSVAIDPTDRLQLERAVLEIEEKSAAELVVTVLRRCDRYDGARWRCAAWLALVAGAAASLVPGAPASLAWCGVAAGGVLGLLIGRARPIQRLLLPEAVLEECVADAAWDAFAHAGLTRTPGGRGVLLFAALFERRVVVLGDEGIDRERGPDESWQRAAEAVAVAARDEGLAAGLLAGIRACGELIVRHAPGSAGAPGERPPPVRLED